MQVLNVISGIEPFGNAGADCRNFNSRFLVAANGTFLMLGAVFRFGGFLVRYPLKGMSRNLGLFTAVCAFVPVVGFISLPFTAHR